MFKQVRKQPVGSGNSRSICVTLVKGADRVLSIYLGGGGWENIFLKFRIQKFTVS